MNKGLEYKNNKTMQENKFKELIKREWKKVPDTSGLYYDSHKLYEGVQKEFAYNLPQHGWVVIGGKGSFIDTSADIPGFKE